MSTALDWNYFEVDSLKYFYLNKLTNPLGMEKLEI